MKAAQRIDERRIAVIGFGEAGRILGAGWAASGRFDVSAYDILIHDPATRDAMLAAAKDGGVAMAESHREAIAGAAVIVSAVTALASTDVAREAAAWLAPGQLFADINSVSPGTKQGNAKLIEDAGGSYLDVAVMAPVPPYGLKVPILLGGARAHDFAERMRPAGMKLEVVADDIGTASAIKMSRSVMIKGMEALVVECCLGARHYGVEDRVLASLEETFPQLKWGERANYLISRVVVHGRRRAAEMREVAVTMAEAGLTPRMASAGRSSTRTVLPPNTGHCAIDACSIPGSVTSTPKTGLPRTLSGMSRRCSGLPAIFQAAGSRSAIFFGGVSFAAATATSP
jgi:3-hydroxyisobutyrate dehydrogenase-like beta-hydroxyacid dehydrogenase